MLYVFDHIYKTGGTTFHSSYVPTAFPERARCVLSGLAEENERDRERLLRLPDRKLRALEIVAGHNAGLLRPHLPGAQFITLIREPVARVISGYLHARYHGPARELIGARIESEGIGLAEFVERDLFAAAYEPFVSVHDWQARVLLGEDPRLATQSADPGARIRNRFRLVGLTERLDEFLFLLHLWEGFPLVLFNDRLVRSPTERMQPQPSDLETIRAFNAADLGVYEWARREFDRLWEEHVDAAAADRFASYREALQDFRSGTGGDPARAEVYRPGGLRGLRARLRRRALR